MKPYEEFKKTVYDALENSHLLPEEITEQDSAITLSISNDDDTPECLKNLSHILVSEQLRFNSSISVSSQIQTIRISVFNY
ncbi:hypothetical protein [Emticicia agri]|uniref:Uncharacterized protein n=1 Tax=Emticicia agri TaxID=2492393 RepID=A0A4Q5LVN8_9BACT|nr:hypothetical protein [Emticicia agri]RYU93577.1 hypothetical protein EWM59_21255 [Emticicia agri]